MLQPGAFVLLNPVVSWVSLSEDHLPKVGLTPPNIRTCNAIVNLISREFTRWDLHHTHMQVRYTGSIN